MLLHSGPAQLLSNDMNSVMTAVGQKGQKCVSMLCLCLVFTCSMGTISTRSFTPLFFIHTHYYRNHRLDFISSHHFVALNFTGLSFPMNFS